MEESEKCKQNWTWPDNFNTYFFIIFDCCRQKFICRTETKHLAISPSSFEKD